MLSGAVLYAKDFRRLAAFYEAVAGLEVARMDDDFIALGGRTSELVILQIPAEFAASTEISSPPVRRERTPIKLVFSVADISFARQMAVDLGGELNPPEREWKYEGATVCDGYDPEGNVFQLRSAPAASTPRSS